MTKEIKFEFPIRKKDDSAYSVAELFDIQEKETAGHYLLSKNGFWHGGIHFSSESHDKSLPIRAIADGKVIAYRVNKKNKESCYQDKDTELTLDYSSGFCLIKHEYGVKRKKSEEELAKEKKDAFLQELKDKVESKDITIDKNGYGTYEVTEFEKFLKDSSTQITRQETIASLKLKIKNMLEEPSLPPSGGSTKYYFAKAKVLGDKTPYVKGDELYIALFKEDGAIFNDIFKANEDSSKDDSDKDSAPLENKIVFYSLYMHLLAYDNFEDKERPSYWEEQDEEQSEAKSTDQAEKKKREPKGFEDVETVEIDVKAGDIIGYMGAYDILIEDPENPGKITVNKVPKDKESSSKNGNPEEEGDNFIRDYATRAKRYTVRRGDTLTKIAQNQTDIANSELGTNINSSHMMEEILNCEGNDALRGNPNSLFVDREIYIPVYKKKDSPKPDEEKEPEEETLESKHQVHLEIFILTEDDVHTLLDNPAQLDQGRRYVKVNAGVNLYPSTLGLDNPYVNADSTAVDQQIKAAQEGKTQQEKDEIKVKYEALEKASEAAIKIDEILIAELVNQTLIKSGTTEYYEIKNAEGTIYRVKKTDVNGEPFCQHDWRKMGFEIAEGSSDSYGYLTDKKKAKIFDELNEKIPREYQAAVTEYVSQSDFRDRIFNPKKHDYYRRRIIARHPTEWQGEENSEFIKMLKLLTRAEDDPPTLSNYLKGVVQKYLEKDEDKDRAKALFEHEKERIKKLAFWSDVSELSTLMPYHINPIAFLGNAMENYKSSDAIKIAIDAGHGGNGSTAGKRTASLPKIKDGNWDFSNLTEKIFYEWDFNNIVAQTVMTELDMYTNAIVKRFDDTTGKTDIGGIVNKKHTLTDKRVKPAKEWGAKFYISCHHNALAGVWGSHQGLETIIDSSASNNSLSKKIADEVQANILKVYDLTPGALGDRGVKKNSLAVLKFLQEDEGAILVEGGFMDSKVDIDYMVNKDYTLNEAKLIELGKAIADGVAKALELRK